MRTHAGGFTKIAFGVLIALLTVCRAPVPTDVTVDQVEVVDQPFPPNYPSTKPINPRTIATLHRGDRVYVRDQGTAKDYMYYTVELTNGQRGYVILSGEWPFRQHNFYEYAR